MELNLASEQELENIIQLTLSRIEEKQYKVSPPSEEDPHFSSLFFISASFTYQYLNDLNVNLDEYYDESLPNRFKVIVNGMKLMLENHSTPLDYWEVLTYFDEPCGSSNNSNVTPEKIIIPSEQIMRINEVAPFHVGNVHNLKERMNLESKKKNRTRSSMNKNIQAPSRKKEPVDVKENFERRKPQIKHNGLKEKKKKNPLRCSNIDSVTDSILNVLSEHQTVVVYSNYDPKLIKRNVRLSIPRKILLDRRTKEHDLREIMSRIKFISNIKNVLGCEIDIIYGHVDITERRILSMLENLPDRFLKSLRQDVFGIN